MAARQLVTRLARFSVGGSSSSNISSSSSSSSGSSTYGIVIGAARASCSRQPAIRRTYMTQADASEVKIGNLSPLFPAKKPKRLGRGSSSGRGGTSTRGHKGQKSRAGNNKPTPGFEGGQTPLMRRYPKRGFTNHFAKEYTPVNLPRIQEWIDLGRLDPTKPITAKELYESRCIHSYNDGVKVLGRNSAGLTTPIQLVVSKASQTAIEQIERQGGSILCKYYTPNTLRALVKPHKYEGRLLPRDAVPISKRELVWYASAANRGYLANMVPTKRMPRVAIVEDGAAAAAAVPQRAAGATVTATSAEAVA